MAKYYNVTTNENVVISLFPESVEQLEEPKHALKVFPNPSERWVVLQQPGIVESVRDVKVVDALGRNVSGFTWSYSDTDKVVLDLGNVPAGIYFVYPIANGQEAGGMYKLIKK